MFQIAARPGAQHLRCLYRVTFVPRDAYDLLRKDSMAFEYLYLQVNGCVGSTSGPLAPALGLPERSLSLVHSRNFCTFPWHSPSPFTCGPALNQLDACLKAFCRGGSIGQPPLLRGSLTFDAPSLALTSCNPTLPSFVARDVACSPFLWSRALLILSGCNVEQTEPLIPSSVFLGPVQYLYPGPARSLALFKRPSWKSMGKWLWNYRKLLQLLYQLRFLLYLLARLKSLGKWALRLKIVAIIVRNIELIMKHLKKLRAVGEVFLRWRMVRKLLAQVKRIMKKYIRWNVLWKLLRKIFRR